MTLRFHDFFYFLRKFHENGDFINKIEFRLTYKNVNNYFSANFRIFWHLDYELRHVGLHFKPKLNHVIWRAM